MSLVFIVATFLFIRSEERRVGKALEMLKDNPDLATTKNKYGETALHLLACNPSAFASGSQLGSLTSHINSCELF